MKKTITALLLVCTLAFCFCACGKKETVKTFSKEDFAELGISLEAPEGAENLEYAVVESKAANNEDLNIAQISFDYNGVKCILRGANVGEHNVSGYEENKAESEEQYDLNIGEYSSQIRVMQIEGKYVSIWTLGEHSYSMCTETDDSVTATSCAMDAANANVPASSAPATTEAEYSY